MINNNQVVIINNELKKYLKSKIINKENKVNKSLEINF